MGSILQLSTTRNVTIPSANSPLDYNSWNHGDVFTNDSYEDNPTAYASHPGTNTPYGSPSPVVGSVPK